MTSKNTIRYPAYLQSSSSNYAIIDETQNNLVVSVNGGNFIYNGNTSINLDLSSLAAGSKVEILNHTSHKIYLFGFSAFIWNGTTTTLQTDKGLIVEKGSIAISKLNNNLLLFNILPNGLQQNWKVGTVFTGSIYWKFNWNGNLTEVQYALTDGIATRLTPNLGQNNIVALVQGPNFNAATPSFSGISDGNLGSGNSQYIGSDSSGSYAEMTVQFSVPTQIISILIAGQGDTTNLYNAPSNFIVSSSNDGINFDLVKNISLGAVGNSSSPFTGTTLRPAILTSYLL